MNISAHVNITNPEKMGYPYLESIKSFANFCDEVIVVDGGSTDGSLEKIKEIPKVKIIEGKKWGYDFEWKTMPKNLQIGLEACQGKWVIKFDIDYIFHEKDVKQFKEELAKCHLVAAELEKFNSVLVNKFFSKNFYPFILNRKDFKNAGYGFGRAVGGAYGASFLFPIVINNRMKDGLNSGEFIRMGNMRIHRLKIPMYCYDFTFMTKEQVIDQRYRFENSLARHLGRKEMSKEYVFKKFKKMMKARYKLCKKEMKLEDHPVVIQEKVKNITPDMFGYNGWGEWK